MKVTFRGRNGRHAQEVAVLAKDFVERNAKASSAKAPMKK